MIWFSVCAVVSVAMYHSCTNDIPHNIEYKDCYGVNVSHHNKYVDWNMLAYNHPHIKFVYIKATEGSTIKDANYAKYLEDARKAGIKVGAYHYLHSTSTIRDQFRNFSQMVKRSDIDLIPAVEVEERNNWSRSEFQDSLLLFINLVKDEFGVAPMIYSANSFYNENCAPEFNVYHLWIGRYGKNKPAIKGRGTYTLWKFSESLQLKGTLKTMDYNLFNAKYTLKDISIK